MRQIVRRRDIVADTVRYPGEDADPTKRLVRPMAEFLAAANDTAVNDAAAANAAAAAGNDAVLVGPTDEVERLVPYLERLSLIVVHFVTAGDGRGFSQASLLRQRWRYTGELRARGAIKRDQLFFLARCGFDSFDLDPAEDLAASLAAFDSFSVAYQGGSDELVHVRRREVV